MTMTDDTATAPVLPVCITTELTGRDGRTMESRWTTTLPATIADAADVERVDLRLTTSHWSDRKAFITRVNVVEVHKRTGPFAAESIAPLDAITVDVQPCARFSAKHLEAAHLAATRRLRIRVCDVGERFPQAEREANRRLRDLVARVDHGAH